jgi:acetyl esterase/lipase
MHLLLPALTGLVMLSGLSSVLCADEPFATLDVWSVKPPGETGTLGPERYLEQKPGDKPVQRLTDISRPTLTIYRPAKEKDTRTAIVIAPGGGYHILAWDLEGVEVARWLNSVGVTGIILKYRVPRRQGDSANQPPSRALMDAQRAVSLVRSKASEWNLDPHRIGMLGKLVPIPPSIRWTR